MLAIRVKIDEEWLKHLITSNIEIWGEGGCDIEGCVKSLIVNKDKWLKFERKEQQTEEKGTKDFNALMKHRKEQIKCSP